MDDMDIKQRITQSNPNMRTHDRSKMWTQQGLVNDWIREVRKREKAKTIPSFLAWATFQIMVLLTEKINTGEGNFGCGQRNEDELNFGKIDFECK